MSVDLTRIDGGRDIERFDPERFRLKQAALDYGIEEAKRLKDWPELVRAVDKKIEEQQRFIAWREANIRGVGQPKKNGDGPVTILSDKQITDISGITKKQAERMGSKLAYPDQYRIYLLGSEYTAAFLQPVENVRGTMGTGNNEWFTPPEYLVLVREVLGEIDLDPASSAEAQKIVRAKQFFDKGTDGLKQEWHGRVFLNPPYGRSLIGLFTAKLAAEWKAGRIESAITLTHNYTDPFWFQNDLVPSASAICFTCGRIEFLGDHVPDPTQGQAFCYLGQDVDLFGEVFTSIGFVAKELLPRDSAHRLLDARG